MDSTFTAVAAGGLAEMLLPLVIIFGIIYLLVIRPKQSGPEVVTFGEYPAWRRNIVYVLALVCVFVSGAIIGGGLMEHLILVIVMGLIGHLLVARILEPRHIAKECARIRSEYSSKLRRL